MADQQLGNKSRNLEECIQERASNDTSPIFAQKSLERSETRGFIGPIPIPINSGASNTEID